MIDKCLSSSIEGRQFLIFEIKSALKGLKKQTGGLFLKCCMASKGSAPLVK